MSKYKVPQLHKPVPEHKKIYYYNPLDLLDPTFTTNTIIEYIKNKTPFAYLRYNDGEWRGLLGREVWNKYWKNTGNGDKHDFFDDMMYDLRQVLKDISDLPKEDKIHIHVGLHGTWDQKEIQTYVVENNLKDTINWVGTIRPVESIWDKTFLNFMDFIKDNNSICKVAVTKKTLIPVLNKINIDHHVEVSDLNAYLNYNDYYGKLSTICETEDRPVLIMLSMGPSSNILGYRIYEKYKNIMIFNTGVVFDAFIGSKIRAFLTKPDFIEWFKENYKKYLD